MTAIPKMDMASHRHISTTMMANRITVKNCVANPQTRGSCEPTEKIM
jgi:hypothetical protein